MSNRKFAKAIQGLPRSVRRLYRSLTKAFLDLILRLTLGQPRRGNPTTAGFVLPTTVLLILVVALTVGALTFRAYNRNTQAIGDAQQRVIYNAATPAIDRARSKLEFLFDPTRNRLLPGGVPPESSLFKFLLNNDPDPKQRVLVEDDAGNQVSPYDLPDERRIDIDNDGKVDNAWSFRTDTNADGKADATVLYSIILQTPPIPKGSKEKLDTLLVKMPEEEKANKLIVRHGPLGNDIKGIRCSTNSSRAVEEGWFEDSSSTATLRKNFQVDALVIPDDQKSATVTLEMHQDRQVNRGNKWGAWFRNDLEIYPGPAFNWNGAMHTEGSLIIGQFINGITANDENSRPTNGFVAHLISAPASCLFEPASNSEITVTDYKNEKSGKREFMGIAFAGDLKNNLANTNNSNKSNAMIFVHGSRPEKNGKVFTRTTDASKGTFTPIQISIDPKKILLEDGYQNRRASGDTTNADADEWSTLEGEINVQGITRIKRDTQKAPYIDDLYRADDRWGPKPKYDSNENGTIPPETKIGQPITGASYGRLTNMPDPPEADKSNAGVGLDGYWERRARNEGLRILVGERLELGNLNTWFAPRDRNGDGRFDPLEEGDPLYPPTVAPFPPVIRTGNAHEDLQRRTLRDNLSGVQATAIYHRANTGNNDYPVACLATTAHPGTVTTLRQSINFKPTKFVKGSDGSNNPPTFEYLLSNFFTGRGTNGWEFQPPAGDADTFISQLSAGQPLRVALDNLANFAGDPDGAFPPKPDDNSRIHPYPALTMWGNYSNLRRAITQLDAVGYANLSLADKTYLQTAACTLGILAYNINEIQQFDPANLQNDSAIEMFVNGKPVMTDLAERLDRLMDGVLDPRSGNFEVLPKGQLSTYSYNPNGNYTPDYKAEDYYQVPPEAFIGGLKQSLAWELSSMPDKTIEDLDNDPRIRLAELIMLRHQIRRDRTFGFRPSPAFGEYVVDMNGVNRVFPTACDPDEFPFAAVQRGNQFALSSLRLVGNRALGASAALTSIPYNADVPAIPARQSSDLAALAARPSIKHLGGNSYDYDYDANSRQDGIAEIRDRYSRYRLALSRLCGTIQLPAGYEIGNQNLEVEKQPTVLPKFPSLYYIFPEKEHGLLGAEEPTAFTTPEGLQIKYDHRQPGSGTLPGNPASEPYIADSYISSVNGGVQFKVVSTTAVQGRAGLAPKPHPLQTENIQPVVPREAIPNIRGSQPSSRPYANVMPLPLADNSVKAVAIAPREFPSDLNTDINGSNANLPKLPNPANYTNKAAAATETAIGGTKNEFNVPTNFILAPPRGKPDDATSVVAVPFLDRAIFDGRQYMVARTLDIDLGMLRANTALNRTDDNWLPNSGIIYAFREDAVREDAIKRPDGTRMDLTNLSAPKDPRITDSRGISEKSIDFMPDPDRRIHGFRLRNGRNLRRNTIDSTKEFYFRGLSFFSDQPVYIQGDFNHHQLADGTRLEEFKDKLPVDKPYTAKEFYVNRTTVDPDFAEVDKDLWRPAEILADSITFLSKDFCDGSIADSFVQTRLESVRDNNFRDGNGFIPDFTIPTNQTNLGSNQGIIYNRFGLYGPGCLNASNGRTSFHNQNRPTKELPNKFDWVREASSSATLPQRNDNSSLNYWADFTSPIKVSRAGQPLVVGAQPNGASETQPSLPAVQTYAETSGATFFGVTSGNDGARLMAPVDTRINSIIVSGIHPSRARQGYGGLHNFPRFLENWGGKKLFFNGSFLQLNFTNYATASFETEAWEPSQNTDLNTSPVANESIPYYVPPQRFWGYDVALQLSPAGPAASRFVTADKNRSEFYSEPPANDAFIGKLCNAARGNGEALVPSARKATLNCPGKN